MLPTSALMSLGQGCSWKDVALIPLRMFLFSLLGEWGYPTFEGLFIFGNLFGEQILLTAKTSVL